MWTDVSSSIFLKSTWVQLNSPVKVTQSLLGFPAAQGWASLSSRIPRGLLHPAPKLLCSGDSCRASSSATSLPLWGSGAFGKSEDPMKVSSPPPYRIQPPLQSFFQDGVCPYYQSLFLSPLLRVSLHLLFHKGILLAPPLSLHPIQDTSHDPLDRRQKDFALSSFHFPPTGNDSKGSVSHLLRGGSDFMQPAKCKLIFKDNILLQ